MKINALLFIKIMTNLLKTGLPLQNALYLASDICQNKDDKEFCNHLYNEVTKGHSLSSCFDKYNDIFSPLYVSLLQVGEETGNLTDVFERLCEYQEEKKAKKDQLIQSLTYPALVLFTALAVIFIIVFFVFPNLEGILDAFSENSFVLEQRIASIKTTFVVSGIIFFTVIFILSLFVLLRKTSEKVKYFTDSLLLKIPLLGKHIKFEQCHDFSFSMKLLSKAGYTFTDSLFSSSKVITNQKIKKSILTVYSKISKGEQSATSFESEMIFPPYFVSWIKLAETNGNVEEAFSQLYEYYRNENKNFAKELSNAMEPFFILITGIIIFAIIAQFVIPVFKLAGTL